MPTNTLPTNSHFISLATAIEMTSTYRDEKLNILASNLQNVDILPNSETFNRAAIETLLAIEGCEGLRIYNGMDENLKVHSIIVAVNEDNEDILPSPSINPGGDYIVEEGQRCPTNCPPASDLNE